MKQLYTIFFCLLLVHIAQAQRPEFHTFEYDDQSIIQGMSDNGRWAVASGGDGAAVRLLDLDTFEATIISSANCVESASDVTDAGNIIVGSESAKPAVYLTEAKTWCQLETRSPYLYGKAYSVTPDGSYAVGVLYYEDGMLSIPALWELNEGTLVSTPGLPTLDMSHADQGQMDFRAISADGKTILGCMSYSYLPTAYDLGGCFYFTYDREAHTYHPIGFSETVVGRWTPKADGVIVIMGAAMSNNGRYVTGSAHVARDIEGTDYADEYKVPYLYDVLADKFATYDETLVSDTYGSAVTNDGTIVDVSPEGNPVREWNVRHDKYWFSFAEILKQKYNTTIVEETTFSNTGTVSCISNDGKRLVSFPDPYCSYVVDLPVTLSAIGEGIRLLGSYIISPAAGSEVSHLKNVTITFDRNITAVGGANSAELLDSEGNRVYGSVGFSADGKTLSIRFRTGTLTEGEDYRLFIPEGTVALADDATQTNSDMYFDYRGRADVPVQLVSAYPAEGTAFSHIDYSTSPVILTFDTQIAITDEGQGYLYRNSETQPYCSLILASGGNQLALYPSTTQYLYDGSTYRVEVKAGSVTDVAGNNANETLTLTYQGNYVREISADDVILFSDNFDNGYGNFMQWCGDQNTPVSEMIGWDFTQGMAWGLVRDDEASSDRMAASHSMYSPAGQSDDWLVIPQLYIPDMLCSVQFLSQSYKADKADTLQIIVWESNNVYNTLTDEVIDLMKQEGHLLYNERQRPGQTEDYLGGEWTHSKVSLADFAGKNVYIAFVNQNRDQSAIFMDSLQVRHDMHYLTTLHYEESVVGQETVTIRGSLVGNSDEHSYQVAVIELRDSEGNILSTYTASQLNLRKGDRHEFAFDAPLPLVIGEENPFSVLVSLDDEVNEIKGSIRNLAFQPRKRVVLEEYTGRSCGNCPIGILAIERLEALYGDAFIPVSIHTYGNDPLSSGLGNYTSLLGLNDLGAPSGTINRGTGCYPAVSAESDGTYRYFFSAAEADGSADKMWMDYVADELAVPAVSDISITHLTWDEESRTFSAECAIQYALHATNQTVNLFTVLLEDNLSQPQQNYLSSVSSPDLGEWGQGGRYGQSVVSDYLHQDVCRSVSGLTINGTGGYLPSTVEAGQIYPATVSVTAPASVQSLQQCKVVVMMINANTGRVINATCCQYSASDAIEAVTADTSLPHDLPCYDLSGRRISPRTLGLIIVGGRRVFNR